MEDKVTLIYSSFHTQTSIMVSLEEEYKTLSERLQNGEENFMAFHFFGYDRTGYERVMRILDMYKI